MDRCQEDASYTLMGIFSDTDGLQVVFQADTQFFSQGLVKFLLRERFTNPHQLEQEWTVISLLWVCHLHL